MQTNNNRNMFHLLVFIILVILIIGWFLYPNKDENINKYLLKLKQTLAIKYKTHVNSTLPFHAPTPIVYTAHPERSPFNKEAPLNQALSPLLMYPISMLKFMGTMSTSGKNFAYVIAPDNKLYQVKIGDRIGDHGGVVSQISTDHMDITEENTEENSNGAQRIVTLQLKEENK
ncbi:MAG: pilus assembly protein PilP [Gammaproteobacteria bacterium]